MITSLKPLKLNNFKIKTKIPSYYSDWTRLKPRPRYLGIRKPINTQTVFNRINKMKMSQVKPLNYNQAVKPIKPIKPMTILKSN